MTTELRRAAQAVYDAFYGPISKNMWHSPMGRGEELRLILHRLGEALDRSPSAPDPPCAECEKLRAERDEWKSLLTTADKELESIEEYWNGNDASAVDGATVMTARATNARRILTDATRKLEGK